MYNISHTKCPIENTNRYRDAKNLSKNISITLFLMALLTIVFFYFSVDTSESGVIEHTQDIVLIIAVISWAITFYKLKGYNNDRTFHPIFAAFFTLLVYIVLGRELSWLRVIGVDRNIAKVVEYLNASMAIILLFIFTYYWIFKVRNQRKELLEFLKSSSFKYALISLFFILIGDVFEKDLIPLSSHQLFEEMSELTGHVFILLSALSAIRNRSKSSRERL